MAVHLVLSGSGARFASFIGSYISILRVYPRLMKELKTVIATSGGALVGALICLDYSVHAIEDLCLHLEYNDLKNLDINRFLLDYGVESGSSIVKLFKAVIKKKLGDGEATFKDLFNKTGRTLIITGTNISTMSLVSFSHETHPDMQIWRALRITISIPFLFTTTRYQGHHYVDGGVLCQFPIRFLPMLGPFDSVIGINLEFKNQHNDIHDVVSYIKALTKTIFKSVNFIDFADLDEKFTIIRIITENLSAFDLDISVTVRQQLMDSAKRQTHDHLEKPEQVVRRFIKKVFLNVLAASA